MRVHEGVSVGSINFSATNPTQPVSATWKSDTGATGEIKFNWLVDASGRAGIMSTRYLKNRKFNKALRSVATWGYWTGTGMYAPGTSRENATWLEALTGQWPIRRRGSLADDMFSSFFSRRERMGVSFPR